MRDSRTGALAVAMAVAVVAAAAVAGSAWSSRAAAQQESPSALVARGVALRAQGNDVEALALFERAQRMEPRAATLAQIALAEQALSRWVAAEAHLSAALEDRNDPWIASNRAVLARALETIRTHVGSLEVVGSPAGAVVTVRGERAGTLPLARPLVLETGDAHVEVTAPGYGSTGADLVIAPGRVTRYRAELSRGAAAETPERELDTPRREPSQLARGSVSEQDGGARVWTWVAGGAAVAFAGAAVALWLIGDSAYSDLESTCGGAGCSDEQIAESDIETYDLLTNVSLALSVACLVGAVTLFVVEGSGGDASDDASAAVALRVGPGALQLDGRF